MKPRSLNTLTVAVILSSSLLRAETETVAAYNLGEDDAGAANGVAGSDPTTAFVGTDATIGSGNPMYSNNSPGGSSTLSMSMAGGTYYWTGSSIDLGTDNWGMEGWVYSTDAGNGGWAYANGRYLIGQFGGRFLWHRNGQGDAAGLPVVTNQWHHMALVRDGGVLTAYFDGVPQATTDRTDSWDFEFGIGARGYDGRETWIGQVDAVRFFTFEPGEFDPATDLMSTRFPADACPRLQLDVDYLPDSDELTIGWESSEGTLYRLRSDVDPSVNPPAEWAVFGGNEDIAATPPRNSLTISLPAEQTRLFVIESYPPPPEKVLSDDFESGQGSWVVDNSVPGDSPPTNWEFGTPDSNLVGGPSAANSGSICFGTNLAGYTGNDAAVVLVSPIIDLTAAAGATLTFAHFGNFDDGFDFGQIRVLDADNGDAELALIDDMITGSFDWQQYSAAIPAEALGNNVRISFTFDSDDDNIGLDFAGWYIDDVCVTVP